MNAALHEFIITLDCVRIRSAFVGDPADILDREVL